MAEHIFEGKPVRTYGDMGDLVVAIAKAGDRARALAFLQSYRDFCEAETGKPENADANIGYWTGYLDADLGRKARALFGVRHPILPLDEPDYDQREAFLAGQAMGRGESSGNLGEQA